MSHAHRRSLELFAGVEAFIGSPGQFVLQLESESGGSGRSESLALSLSHESEQCCNIQVTVAPVQDYQIEVRDRARIGSRL